MGVIAPSHEASLIGSLVTFQDRGAFTDLHEDLRPEDFQYQPAATAYTALLGLHAQGVRLNDAESQLHDALGDGAYSFVAECADAASTGANVRYHSRTIIERAVRGQIYDVLAEALSNDLQGPLDTLAVVAKVASKLEPLEARLAFIDTGMGTTLEAGLHEAIRRAEEARSGKIRTVKTGLPKIDLYTGGIRPGDSWVIAGPTGGGKSTLALQVAMKAAEDGWKTAIVSLEMPDHQLYGRLLGRVAGIEPWRIDQGRLSDGEWPQLTQAGALAQARMGEDGIRVIDEDGLTISRICGLCRRLHKRGELDFLVVDYLQLIGGSGYENRHQEVAAASRTLKRLSMGLRIPVVLLAQYNRGVNKQRPELEHLAESGAIEKDASVVLLIGQDEAERPDKIRIAKNRHGEKRTVGVLFDGRKLEFHELTDRKE